MHFLFTCLFASVCALKDIPNNSWAQKTLDQMSLDEKIGQLFMIAGYVDPEYARREIGNEGIIQEIDRYITEYHIGGIAYVGPSEYAKQVVLTNHYQELSKYPLLIAQDLEWGLSMRMKDALRFPKNITLGAVQNNDLIYEMGKEIGRQAKLVGVHMNLSPVLDVNSEPDNIVINVRSFGSSPYEVAEKGIAMIQGMQDAGIIASAKHFPGLGDITVDPHLALPMSPHAKGRLHEVEFYPFVRAIEAGVLSIQTEHLMVPALDEKMPASLSPNIVADVLKKELGFKGLVLSGALRMKALTNERPTEEIAVSAFLAGSDMLLMPDDFPKAYQALKKALIAGKISEQEVDERVLKILQMKEKVHLRCNKIVSIPTQEQMHSPFGQSLKECLYQNAVSLLRSKDMNPVSKKVGYVQLGEAPTTEFAEQLQESLQFDSYFFSFEKDVAVEEQKLLQNMEKYSLVIMAVYPADPRRIAEIRLLNEQSQKEELKQFRVHGLTEQLVRLAQELQQYQEKTVIAFFGNPFGLPFFDSYETLVMAYEPDPDAQHAAANIIIRRILDFRP